MIVSWPGRCPLTCDDGVYEDHAPRPKGICEMRLLYSEANTSAQFDDLNLVSCAGLVPVMRLVQRCNFAGLVGEHLR